MELIALLSRGEGTWAQVSGIIKQGEWENIILLGSEFAKKFQIEKEHIFIELKSSRLVDLKKEIEEKGVMPLLAQNYLDKHEAINNTARALTEKGLTFIAAPNLHHRGC